MKLLSVSIQLKAIEQYFPVQVLFIMLYKLAITFRASDISRKKRQNFAGFSGANSRKNWPISREKKSKFAKKSADFAGFLREKSQNLQKNWRISRDFSGKQSNFEGFSGANS